MHKFHLHIDRTDIEDLNWDDEQILMGFKNTIKSILKNPWGFDVEGDFQIDFAGMKNQLVLLQGHKHIPTHIVVRKEVREDEIVLSAYIE